MQMLYPTWICVSGRKMFRENFPILCAAFCEKWIETTLCFLCRAIHGTFSNRTQIFIFSTQTKRLRGFFLFHSCMNSFRTHAARVNKTVLYSRVSWFFFAPNASMFEFNFEFQFNYFPVAQALLSHPGLMFNHES